MFFQRYLHLIVAGASRTSRTAFCARAARSLSAAAVGVVSGVYIWREPLQEHHARAAAAEEAARDAAMRQRGTTPAVLDDTAVRHDGQ